MTPVISGVKCGVKTGKEEAMRMRWTTCGYLAAVVLLGTGTASGDVLLEQPVDFEHRYYSFYDPSGVQLGDDIAINEPVVIESATFFMVATTGSSEPWQWSFSVHRFDPNHPYYEIAPVYDHFYRQFNPSNVTDLGPWPQEEHLHLFEVRFDNIGLLLEPTHGDERDRFWFSCGGHLLNYPADRCYWATSGNGVIQGEEGMLKFVPWDWPGWSRMTRYGGTRTDLAMRIEGVPVAEWQPTTELTDFEVDYGWLPTGDLGDLQVAGDERVVSYRSKPGRRDGQKYYVSSLTATVRTLVDNPDVLDISVSADVQRIFQVPEALLFLHNHRTGKWDEVGRYDVYVERVTWPFRDIPAADYVNADGEIELRFEVRGGPITHPQERFTYFFNTNVDRIQIDARQVD